MATRAGAAGQAGSLPAAGGRAAAPTRHRAGRRGPARQTPPPTPSALDPGADPARRHTGRWVDSTRSNSGGAAPRARLHTHNPHNAPPPPGGPPRRAGAGPAAPPSAAAAVAPRAAEVVVGIDQPLDPQRRLDLADAPRRVDTVYARGATLRRAWRAVRDAGAVPRMAGRPAGRGGTPGGRGARRAAARCCARCVALLHCTRPPTSAGGDALAHNAPTGASGARAPHQPAAAPGPRRVQQKRNPITNVDKTIEICFYPEYYKLTKPVYNIRETIFVAVK
jgi:hypothetical protein